MAGDQVHRIVGQETVHRRAFGGGLVGGALAILRRHGQQHRLRQRRQHGNNGDLPQGQGEAGGRQHIRRRHAGQNQERRARGDTGAHHLCASAGQCGFNRNQHKPHQQGRGHAAGQRRQITDQRGEQDQARLLQHRQRQRQKTRKGEKDRGQQAGNRDDLGGVGAPRENIKTGGHGCAHASLGRLHGDKPPPWSPDP